ncbi:Rps9bp [Saccharomyces cerevisiae x Saccharomyces kudriavzevii VIN7]|uniref:Rps9bp n=1 Tax=Saccharomyces cerevisiae x Saccharomyces kudriavzevii (strain VIN7) TaxID=1095631 RepID=H0GRH4_SACCK|nr:Rps9bp [Saccharomyces cerevisiae x Saccharomyces kudriavzevii VIN7]
MIRDLKSYKNYYTVIKSANYLFFVFSFFSSFTGRFSLSSGVSSGDSTWSGTTEWRGWGKINVLFRVQSDHERWDVDNLLTNSNVSLSDQNSGVVNRLGQT